MNKNRMRLSKSKRDRHWDIVREHHRNMERRKKFSLLVLCAVCIFFFILRLILNCFFSKKNMKEKKSVKCIESWITSNSIFKPKTFNTITSFCRPTHSIIWLWLPSYSHHYCSNELLSLDFIFCLRLLVCAFQPNGNDAFTIE